MNKRIGVIVLVIVLVIGSGIAYLVATAEPDKPSQAATVQDTEDTSEDANRPAGEQSPSAGGKYIDYEEGIIAETSGTTLLFFHAPWCPQCRALEADIKAKGVPDGVTIIKVDYDSNQKLRQQYGVTIQTTVVRVHEDGSLAEKFVAYDDPSLAAVAKELL
jgi:thiol-disulfide isomerase/thioredoxin